MLTKLALFPLLGAQAIWVARRALVLPEPEGARRGQIGSGPPLRLLLLGDSSVAGVGADHQSDALSGRLPPRLAAAFSVEWQLEAETGATSRSLLTRLELLPQQRFDVVFVGLGVNDVTRLVGPSTWLRRQRALHTILRDKFSARFILRSGVPPMGHFPLLPQPLRHVLGQDAKRLDRALAKLCSEMPALGYLPLDLPFDPKYVARDGFHPSPAAYAVWANLIAEKIIAMDLAQ